MEVRQFVYCLLSRTRKVSSLPTLKGWEENMDPEKIDDLGDFAAVDFLRNHYLEVSCAVGKMESGDPFESRVGSS